MMKIKFFKEMGHSMFSYIGFEINGHSENKLLCAQIYAMSQLIIEYSEKSGYTREMSLRGSNIYYRARNPYFDISALLGSFDDYCKQLKKQGEKLEIIFKPKEFWQE